VEPTTPEGKHWGVDPGWVPDPRPVPEALTDTFTAKPYSDPFMVSIQEKIGNAKMEELMAIFGGYPMDPSV